MTTALANPPRIRPTTYGLDPSVPTFTVTEYEQMIEAGILTADTPIELLENYLVLKMSRNPLHDGTITLITINLGKYIPSGWVLRVQLTVVSEDSQPEPDFAVVQGDARSFMIHHPTAADAGLVIEVAESSLLRDRQDKARIYARAGIPVYWIVNLVDRTLEVHEQPNGDVDSPQYQSVHTLGPSDTVSLILDGNSVASIPVAELLP